jgi:hypothetical protein
MSSVLSRSECDLQRITRAAGDKSEIVTVASTAAIRSLFTVKRQQHPVVKWCGSILVKIYQR